MPAASVRKLPPQIAESFPLHEIIQRLEEQLLAAPPQREGHRGERHAQHRETRRSERRAITVKNVSPEERERLIRVYPMIAEWTGGLRLPETRYAEPALIYPAVFER